jgi:hypothetical protein
MTKFDLKSVLKPIGKDETKAMHAEIDTLPKNWDEEFMNADRAFFEANPGRQSYVRKPFPTEYPAFGPFVKVFRLATGVRLRQSTTDRPNGNLQAKR